MKAYLITVGDELLIGDIINTNIAWLGRTLTDVGLDVIAAVTIGDKANDLKQALAAADLKADLVIITGGLGPTHDDITKSVLADFLNTTLILHQPTLDFVKSIFDRRGLPFSTSNRGQADVLKGGNVLKNRLGTAPGLWFVKELTGTIFVALPGVPIEMRGIINKEVLPRLHELHKSLIYTFSTYLQVAGIGESTLYDTRLKQIVDILPDSISMAFLPHSGTITLRITGSDVNSVENAKKMIDTFLNSIKEAIGDDLYAEGKEVTLEAKVGELLIKKCKTIAVAESCTGGAVAHTITKVSGSSRYFKGGVVAYSNSVKIQLLGVDKDTLESVGAVSKETAIQMAKGIRKTLNTDIGLSTTGIAGPDGGTDEKPVGTVWFGYSDEIDSFAFKVRLTNARIQNQERSVIISLDNARRQLERIKSLPYGYKKEY